MTSPARCRQSNQRLFNHILGPAIFIIILNHTVIEGGQTNIEIGLPIRKSIGKECNNIPDSPSCGKRRKSARGYIGASGVVGKAGGRIAIGPFIDHAGLVKLAGKATSLGMSFIKPEDIIRSWCSPNTFNRIGGIKLIFPFTAPMLVKKTDRLRAKGTI